MDGKDQTGMEALESITSHPLYLECSRKLKEAEAGRVYCRHQREHLLDVARIAYILDLERGMGIKKEIVYAAALLHDIGKFRQYEDGTPHEQAGKEIAGKILADTAVFTGTETEIILKAILEHRRQSGEMTRLGKILYEGDKLSRACYACPAEERCNWSAEKKNLGIRY